MTAELYDKFMKALFEVLSIDSAQGEASDDAPFGEGPKKELETTLKIAEGLGFETKNYDNYVGEVVWGSGKPFAVLCHLDVVPAGDLSAWNTNPFTPTIKDGKLFCRGALDDKSGAISVLFAMYRLKEEGLTPKREIRLILGCNEESGWGCIEHYKKVAVMPEEGISPDADFPVIYAEKGILHIRYAVKKLKECVARGGTAANVVCDNAYAKTIIDIKTAKELSLFVDGDKIVSKGKSAHGSTPEKGVNALDKLTLYFEKTGVIQPGTHDKLFGKREGATKLADETGYLTFSPDILTSDDENLYYTVDVRYPSTIDRKTVENYLEKIGNYEVLSFQAPLFCDKNSELVRSLTEIYSEYTGRKEQPVAIGGGTYARALKQGVAFGPAIGEEADSIHQPNEYVTLSTLDAMNEIYKKALYKLCIE